MRGFCIHRGMARFNPYLVRYFPTNPWGQTPQKRAPKVPRETTIKKGQNRDQKIPTLK